MLLWWAGAARTTTSTLWCDTSVSTASSSATFPPSAAGPVESGRDPRSSALNHGDLTVTVGNTTDLGASIGDTGDTDPGTGGGAKPQGS
ncbi:hypothetical protein R3I94_006052 [Phoxinus phoxinus]